jgi:hypothetical protein
MHMLYDSDTFAVVQIQADAADAGAAQTVSATPQLARHGFEIVDKRSGKEVYLDGSWAELFQARLNGWQQKTPSQEEVEEMLESYAELAQMPVVMH